MLLTPIGVLQWTPPQDTVTWILVLTRGVFGGLGHLMVTQAHRHASAAVLGPFLYQQISYMTLFGWLSFGHVPDAAVVAGAAIVVASGLYLLYREFRR